MGDLEPLYCAEQIKVPPALPEILKAWTKQVIREGVQQVSPDHTLLFVSAAACTYVGGRWHRQARELGLMAAHSRIWLGVVPGCRSLRDWFVLPYRARCFSLAYNASFSGHYKRCLARAHLVWSPSSRPDAT